MKIIFSEVKEKVSTKLGIYEIYANNDIPLKIGIATNLKKWLLDYGASRQSGLKNNKRKIIFKAKKSNQKSQYWQSIFTLINSL